MPDEYKNHVPEVGQVVNKKEQREIIQDKKIIGDMIQVYKDVFDGALCMVACSGYKHAVLVSKMYRDQGWKVEHIHGNMNKTDRRIIIRKARQGKINILCTYAVGTEGLDVKEIMGVIWMRLTESLTVWIQLNMRAARVLGKKKNYILIDPMGNLLLHGRPDIDRNWSLETDYKPGQDIPDAPESQICPVCGVANSIDNIKCWICKYDFNTKLDAEGLPVVGRKRKLPKMIDGELVFLDDKFMEGEDGTDKDIDNMDNNDYTMGDNENTGENTNSIELTKIQKVEILSRDLTGLKSKTKFKEGLKWL